jgi:hypothetical protein
MQSCAGNQFKSVLVWLGKYSKVLFITYKYLVLYMPFCRHRFPSNLFFVCSLCPPDNTTEPIFVMKRRTRRNKQFPQRFGVRAFDEAHDKFVHQTLFALMREKKTPKSLDTLQPSYLFIY